MPDDAWITFTADSKILDANQAALDLLGVTLEQLRAAPPGAFDAEPQTPEQQAAFRAAWEGEGQPDIVGASTLQRPDGTRLRVTFGITGMPDGRFIAVMRPLDEPANQRPEIFTAGDVLAHWRAAERRLDALGADAPERAHVERDIERFREAYQQIFRLRGNGSPA